MQLKKHSKYKNTGILFEVLIKKITSETISGKNSPAIGILKKYFNNTELGKEYKLYESLFKNVDLDEKKAQIVLDTLLEASKKLNRNKLKKEKYNLIKELKDYYNIDELFKIKLNNYKTQAAFYILLELYNSPVLVNPQQIIQNKLTLLEHITFNSEVIKPKEDILNEFKTYDKDIRTLTYYILLEKFNSKYKGLNPKQKNILKEFIISVDDTIYLKNLYNKEIKLIKEELLTFIKNKKINDSTKIKLHEVKKYLVELGKNNSLKNEHLIDLLQYHSLLEELNKLNNV